MAGYGCGEAFVDPVAGLQLASYGRVTHRLPVLREIIAEESDGPALFNITAVTGTVDEELLDLFGNALAFGGWAPRWRCSAEPGKALCAIGFEPGADGVLVAVYTLSNVGDTPALSIE
jgi:hypothetical protein